MRLSLVLSFTWHFAPALLRATQSSLKASKRLVTFDDVFGKSFIAETLVPRWTEFGPEGTYVERDSETGSILLKHIETPLVNILVNGSDVNIANFQSSFYDYYVQPTGEHVLFASNHSKQYRYSSFVNYHVFNVLTKQTEPLVPDQAGDIRFAKWAPSGDIIAYVRENNLFVWRNGTSTRITTDGSDEIFNGVPDWVYEEEVSTDALWFSPDARFISFLRFNDTRVPMYRVPYYMSRGNSTPPPYPEFLELRYPKAGQALPSVSVHLADLSDLGSGSVAIDFQPFEPDNLIIGEVAWVTDTHSQMMLRAFNREQNHEKLVLIETSSRSTKVVREREEKNGWIDNFQAIQYVRGSETYLDISDVSGWATLYLFPIHGSEGVPYSFGSQEVTSILKVDPVRKVVCVEVASSQGIERYVWSVALNKTEPYVPLFDTDIRGYFGARFSPNGDYYILSYEGPNVPWQALRSIESPSKTIRVINDNNNLTEKLSSLYLPSISWTTVEHPDGYSLNVMERLPPQFESGRKYPVVFAIYGGPGSQMVSKVFHGVDFNAYLASDPELEYIVLTVDNRGTGFKGRAFRTLVYGQLGKYEAEDQVFVAQEWAKKEYVDGSKIAIMGWSYGGFLSAKVLELDSDVFSFAVITAPVTSWEFYDAIYTERYMGLPSENTAGYAASAITKANGFANARGGLLLQHGLGDDNVHFQSSAVLTDILIQARVGPSKLHVQWFTDSDHRIAFHGASRFVRAQMAQYLAREKRRVEGETRNGLSALSWKKK